MFCFSSFSWPLELEYFNDERIILGHLWF
jgi:hypothetical protein